MDGLSGWKYRLSASELHVIYCALAGIDQKKELEEDTMHSVTLTNYAKVRGSSRQHAKEALRAAGRGLRRSPLTIVEGNGSFIELSWLITIRYDEEEEKLELQWHPRFSLI